MQMFFISWETEKNICYTQNHASRSESATHAKTQNKSKIVEVEFPCAWERMK